MNAFELLKADHKKVAALFDRLETASGQRKLEVFKHIKSELEIHTHIEETILYPALEKPKPTHHLTLEAYEEHKVVKTLLAELAAAKSATDEWQAKARVLRENVEHHVEEEENELFDKATDVLSQEEIEALGVRMEAEKARKQGKRLPKVAAGNARKESMTNPGIIAKIANFVGLGGGDSEKAAKNAAPKTPAKKARVAARSAKKTGKAGSASASKRAAATTGAKRAPLSKASELTTGTALAQKKSSKEKLSKK